MHRFSELVDSCAKFSIATLKSVDEKALEALEVGGATVHVKSLQMVQLQRAILAVGMFSLFEANLQDVFGSEGFEATRRVLSEQDELKAAERFDNVYLAINVLKHGYGRSYKALVERADSLPFKVKRNGEEFFNEGDVTEVRTLVEVDDDFIQLCADVIAEVSGVVGRVSGTSI
ncbi:hypothetical protein J2W27_000019 [Variovorax boronicumulans]|uniref:hypothetical protein n=1 Tax=Variovorax boronicumulans TaxID=436515 RepID=UPI00277D2093|nr:hypothetical protein [Variovorax boronicumulans]MDP9907926.1 hypothetical protein [Variovorax boronicumulans]